MSQVNAMAISLSICGGLATFLILQFGGANISLWAAFVSWACFFFAGGDGDAAKKTIACSLFGSFLGWATMYIITTSSMSATFGFPLWAGIVVAISAPIAVSVSRINLLSTVPVTMCALALIAAFVSLKGSAGDLTALSLNSNALLHVSLSMVIGVGCGMATARMAGMLMNTAAPEEG